MSITFSPKGKKKPTQQPNNNFKGKNNQEIQEARTASIFLLPSHLISEGVQPPARVLFYWGLAHENIIVNSAYTDTETNLPEAQNNNCLFQWYFTTRTWMVWLSMESRAQLTFHTQGSLDDQEAAQS